MFLTNKITIKDIRLIGIALVIVLLIGFNFYLLNKVISSAQTPNNFETRVQISNFIK